ncbi:hypothetical protein CEUSTIGMA_g1249.t1 [Chlamydomonas eustigma]|uniref:Uncharacterized protein n=1 Tax=Chlamydomonas eustigma TaxID=1157962 RepID=A0A250WSI4_9CHLO|nr:hypothetical protein CEUSTIGMA_g1249.t1 [Chlamydomonas eustigma]|eukprot:GAX73798.1 hypothetical protein CEUSTIGMA_g1249.t1 [Chlamydomonas eustigma]
MLVQREPNPLFLGSIVAIFCRKSAFLSFIRVLGDDGKRNSDFNDLKDLLVKVPEEGTNGFVIAAIESCRMQKQHLHLRLRKNEACILYDVNVERLVEGQITYREAALYCQQNAVYHKQRVHDCIARLRRLNHAVKSSASLREGSISLSVHVVEDTPFHHLASSSLERGLSGTHKGSLTLVATRLSSHPTNAEDSLTTNPAEMSVKEPAVSKGLRDPRLHPNPKDVMQAGGGEQAGIVGGYPADTDSIPMYTQDTDQQVQVRLPVVHTLVRRSTSCAHSSVPSSDAAAPQPTDKSKEVLSLAKEMLSEVHYEGLESLVLKQRDSVVAGQALQLAMLELCRRNDAAVGHQAMPSNIPFLTKSGDVNMDREHVLHLLKLTSINRSIQTLVPMILQLRHNEVKMFVLSHARTTGLVQALARSVVTIADRYAGADGICPDLDDLDEVIPAFLSGRVPNPDLLLAKECCAAVEALDRWLSAQGQQLPSQTSGILSQQLASAGHHPPGSGHLSAGGIITSNQLSLSNLYNEVLECLGQSSARHQAADVAMLKRTGSMTVDEGDIATTTDCSLEVLHDVHARGPSVFHHEAHTVVGKYPSTTIPRIPSQAQGGCVPVTLLLPSHYNSLPMCNCALLSQCAVRGPKVHDIDLVEHRNPLDGSSKLIVRTCWHKYCTVSSRHAEKKSLQEQASFMHLPHRLRQSKEMQLSSFNEDPQTREESRDMIWLKTFDLSTFALVAAADTQNVGSYNKFCNYVAALKERKSLMVYKDKAECRSVTSVNLPTTAGQPHTQLATAEPQSQKIFLDCRVLLFTDHALSLEPFRHISEHLSAEERAMLVNNQGLIAVHRFTALEPVPQHIAGQGPQHAAASLFTTSFSLLRANQPLQQASGNLSACHRTRGADSHVPSAAEEPPVPRESIIKPLGGGAAAAAPMLPGPGDPRTLLVAQWIEDWCKTLMASVTSNRSNVMPLSDEIGERLQDGVKDKEETSEEGLCQELLDQALGALNMRKNISAQALLARAQDWRSRTWRAPAGSILQSASLPRQALSPGTHVETALIVSAETGPDRDADLAAIEAVLLEASDIYWTRKAALTEPLINPRQASPTPVLISPNTPPHCPGTTSSPSSPMHCTAAKSSSPSSPMHCAAIKSSFQPLTAGKGVVIDTLLNAVQSNPKASSAVSLEGGTSHLPVSHNTAATVPQATASLSSAAPEPAVHLNAIHDSTMVKPQATGGVSLSSKAATLSQRVHDAGSRQQPRRADGKTVATHVLADRDRVVKSKHCDSGRRTSRNRSQSRERHSFDKKEGYYRTRSRSPEHSFDKEGYYRTRSRSPEHSFDKEGYYRTRSRSPEHIRGRRRRRSRSHEAHKRSHGQDAGGPLVTAGKRKLDSDCTDTSHSVKPRKQVVAAEEPQALRTYSPTHEAMNTSLGGEVKPIQLAGSRPGLAKAAHKVSNLPAGLAIHNCIVSPKSGGKVPLHIPSPYGLPLTSKGHSPASAAAAVDATKQGTPAPGSSNVSAAKISLAQLLRLTQLHAEPPQALAQQPSVISGTEQQQGPAGQDNCSSPSMLMAVPEAAYHGGTYTSSYSGQNLPPPDYSSHGYGSQYYASNYYFSGEGSNLTSGYGSALTPGCDVLGNDIRHSTTGYGGYGGNSCIPTIWPPTNSMTTPSGPNEAAAATTATANTSVYDYYSQFSLPWMTYFSQHLTSSSQAPDNRHSCSATTACAETHSAAAVIPKHSAEISEEEPAAPGTENAADVPYIEVRGEEPAVPGTENAAVTIMGVPEEGPAVPGTDIGVNIPCTEVLEEDPAVPGTENAALGPDGSRLGHNLIPPETQLTRQSNSAGGSDCLRQVDPIFASDCNGPDAQESTQFVAKPTDFPHVSVAATGILSEAQQESA